MFKTLDVSKTAEEHKQGGFRPQDSHNDFGVIMLAGGMFMPHVICMFLPTSLVIIIHV